MSRFRVPKKIWIPALLLALVAALGFATRASAATTVTASTSVTNHPDTTIGGLPGTACTSSSNGPVWANDNFNASLTAVQESTPANTWAVTLRANGYFAPFADPTTCDAISTFGNLVGVYHLTVVSSTPPSASDLKSSYDGPTHSLGSIVADFFNNEATSVNGGAYYFAYQNGNYVQDTAGQRGDIATVKSTSGLFYMKNGASGKCIDVRLGNYTPSAVVQQWQCGVVWEGVPGHNQHFEYITMTDGSQYLEAVPPGGPLTPPLFIRATSQGAGLSLTNSPTPYVYKTGGYFASNGLYFNNASSSTANGNVQIGWPYNGASDERYALIAA